MMYSKEEIREVVKEYEGELIKLRTNYNTVVSDISNNNELTELGKSNKIDKEYKIHKKVNDDLNNKYGKKIKSMIDTRVKVANEKLENINNTIKDSLSAADMLYIQHIIEKGSNQDLVDLAKQYDYNIHILKMINLQGNSNLRNGFKVANPYIEMQNERFIDYVGFPTNVIAKPVKGLWD